jgi:D-glycero-D-manno-heptose 1,7-bisphosphate phosphatase
MTKGAQLRPVVFLDRDGTLNEEVGYITDIKKLVLIKGAAQAVKRLNEAKIAAVLVTNQSGAARGLYSEEHILKLHERLELLLSEHGATLDAVYYCPHLKEGTVAPFNRECDCRKPKPGMVERAYADIKDLDASRAYVVGDKSTDVELASQCRAKSVLVTTGYGDQVLSGTYQWKVTPHHVAANIQEAVDWIMSDLKLSPANS